MIVKSSVFCSSCERQVDKTQALLDSSIKGEPRYLCFFCYKMNKKASNNISGGEKVKKDYFCEHCKYKFKALNSRCPYCGKSDSVRSGHVSVNDLF